MACGMAALISKPAWRYIIGDTFNFRSLLVTKMAPFWNPNFTPPCGPLAAPYLDAHDEPGLYFKSCTWIKVRGSASRPLGHLPRPGRASHP